MDWKKPLRLGIVATALLSLTACASQRDPINRVQPNALAKSFFVGANYTDPSDDPEFRWRNYVVDGSVSQSLIGVGSWGHVDRIRWEVTENYLIARKAYAIADGAGAPSTQVGQPVSYNAVNNGTIVGVWKIESQFDIRRDYNTSTGEETNVVVENTSDRPWQDRDFMRVDWSMNLVLQFNPMWNEMFTGRVFGNLALTPVSYANTNPESDDAIHYELDNGYFDITNKYLISPATVPSPFIDLSGKIPACIMYGIYTGSGTYECDAQEATVRSSFVKIDPNEDFEPLENTKATLDVVGNPGGIGDSFEIGVVNAGRQAWDPQYGYTDHLFHRFASIHNLWKQSHQKVGPLPDSDPTVCTSNIDADKNGTADQCENGKTGYSGSKGSQCDVFFSRCTIPYRDREIKTESYWVNKETPADLLDAVDANGNKTGTTRGTIEDLIYSWNQLISASLAWAKEVECRRTGDGDRTACHGQFFSSGFGVSGNTQGKEMVGFGGWLVDKPKDPPKGPSVALTLCHNPVRPYDLAAPCGQPGSTARVGDVRKNFVFYWPYDSRAPWGGIANWEADPLTGQVIGAAAQIMGRSATFAAAMQRDTIQLAMGDLSLTDITGGKPTDTYAKKLNDGRSPALSDEEIARRAKTIDLNNLRMSTGIVPPNAAAMGISPALAVAQQKALEADTALLNSSALPEFDALAKNVVGSRFEAQIVDSSWALNAVGADPTQPTNGSILDQASPLRALHPGKQALMRKVMDDALHGQGACFLDHEAPTEGSVFLPGLKGYFQAKYGSLDPITRGQKMYDDLWKDAVKGIALHEIGHSLGMLHQFASSWDAVNWQPQYWQLRTNETAISKVTLCTPGTTGGGTPDKCMGARYRDPMTADEAGLGTESRPAIDYFSNTSTMEYQLERFAETAGLGTYDYHTMMALYGRVLDTFDDTHMAPTDQQNFRFKNWTQLIERDLYGKSERTAGFKHYTTMAQLMNVFDPARDCRDATPDEIAQSEWRVVHKKVCAPPPKDAWAWRDFQDDQVFSTNANDVAAYSCYVDKAGDASKGCAGNAKNAHFRWYYRWGTNHNAYFHTNDSDAGGDAYEVTTNTIKRFDQTYPWSYFRRKNREYYYNSIPSRVADRYFDRVRSYHWSMANDFANAQASQLTDPDDLEPYVMAETEVFNFLVRSVLMPEPGDYTVTTTPQRTSPDQTRDIYDTPDNGTVSSPPFTVDIVDGRYVSEDFSNVLGGSWDYLHWINHPGYQVEKSMAMAMLVDGRPTLYTISRQNFLDGRNVSINFRTDLPQATDRLIGGILAEDWETIGPYVTPAKAGDHPVVHATDLTQTTVSRPSGARVLYPNVGYKVQLSTAIWGILLSRSNTDLTLANKMRISVEGFVDGVAVPDAQKVKFTNPESAYTYYAKLYGTDTIDGKVVDSGIGSRMLQHANVLLIAAYQMVLDKTGNPVLDAFGRPTPKLDASGNLQVADAVAVATFRQYVGLIDAVRQIDYLVGNGPLGGGGGGGGGEDKPAAK